MVDTGLEKKLKELITKEYHLPTRVVTAMGLTEDVVFIEIMDGNTILIFLNSRHFSKLYNFSMILEH